MPYIVPERRQELNNWLEKINTFELSEGDLNYIITRILLSTNPSCYADYNKLIGVLESAKLEFYRRAISKYEDVKMKNNGDVYP